ncbi:serine hydrolase domain-containing protein [Fodinibius salsisoli]|uniref:Serine hydrolase n=1 Tax=Fodinibius salsisoli TaxID=2820877 RepID=A0ABT3PSM1_9BACT|nr:serine hydrolase [Fodinibius salsisoli]MCW9708825.1 serine hydrolase [Fodinibius salsisoli]
MLQKIKYPVFLVLIFTIGCLRTKETSIERASRLEMAEKYSAEKSGKALLIWKNGDQILERYQNGADPEKRYPIFEASTLLSGLMALAAIDDGILTLDELVSKTLTEWKKDPQKSKITVSQLLHLTSGLSTDETYPSIKQSIKAPLRHPPGEEFRYGPTAFQLFGLLIERRVGLDYLRNRVLKPLGIKGGYWITTQECTQSNVTMFPRFFDGANLTAQELGRIGNFLVDGGVWNEETIVNDISQLTVPTTASPSYGMGVWLNKKIKSDNDFLQKLPEDIMLLQGLNNERLIYDGAPTDLYMAAGRSNRRLYIIPSKKLVVVRLGTADLTWSDAEFLARLLNGAKLTSRHK